MLWFSLFDYLLSFIGNTQIKLHFRVSMSVLEVGERDSSLRGTKRMVSVSLTFFVSCFITLVSLFTHHMSSYFFC